VYEVSAVIHTLYRALRNILEGASVRRVDHAVDDLVHSILCYRWKELVANEKGYPGR
jgi:hypothetical protein